MPTATVICKDIDALLLPWSVEPALPKPPLSGVARRLTRSRDCTASHSLPRRSKDELRDIILLHDGTGAVTEALVAAVVGNADGITCDELRSVMLRKENCSCIDYLRLVMKATFGATASAVPCSAVPNVPGTAQPPKALCLDNSTAVCSGDAWQLCARAVGKSKVNGRTRKRGCRMRCSAVGVGVWWTIVAAIVVGRACLHHQEHSYRDDAGTELSPTVALSIAKGTGFALLVAFPAVYATRLHLIAYCFWTWLRWLATSTALHAHVGASIFVAGVVHSVAHFAKGENGAAPLLADAQLQTTLTGCGLLLIVVTMSLPAFRRVSNPAAYVSHNCPRQHPPILLLVLPPRRRHVCDTCRGVCSSTSSVLPTAHLLSCHPHVDDAYHVGTGLS